MFIIYSRFKPFLTSVEKIGYEINKGPQKWRGQISGLSYRLSCLDIDFRKSFYNQYHSLMSGYSNIPKNKFSYNNIHMNLGGVRWENITFDKSRDKQIRVLEMVDRISLSFIDLTSCGFKSLLGYTMTL